MNSQQKAVRRYKRTLKAKRQRYAILRGKGYDHVEASRFAGRSLSTIEKMLDKEGGK